MHVHYVHPEAEAGDLWRCPGCRRLVTCRDTHRGALRLERPHWRLRVRDLLSVSRWRAGR